MKKVFMALAISIALTGCSQVILDEVPTSINSKESGYPMVQDIINGKLDAALIVVSETAARSAFPEPWSGS